MDKNNKKRPLVITLCLLFLLFGFLIGYKLNGEYVDVSQCDGYDSIVKKKKKTFNWFFEPSTSFALSDGTIITLSQTKSNDINAGIGLEVSSITNFVYRFDTKGYNNLISSGVIENNDSITLLILMSNSDDKTKVFYETIDKEYINNNIKNGDSTIKNILDNLYIVNTSDTVKKIGTVTIENIVYPVVKIKKDSYMIDANGNLISLD